MPDPATKHRLLNVERIPPCSHRERTVFSPVPALIATRGNGFAIVILLLVSESEASEDL